MMPWDATRGDRDRFTDQQVAGRRAASIEAMQDVLDAIRLLERKLWYTGRTGRKK
jgi:hypothetical protein